MKILVLTNLYPPLFVGGYELHCQAVVEALRARGHAVGVLTSDHGIAGKPAGECVVRTLKIHGLFGHPWLGITQLQHLEKHNNRELRSAVARFQPELVYVWNFGGLSKSMLLTLQNTGLPTVFAICDHWIARSAAADVWLRWWNRRDASPRQRLLRALWTWSGHRDRCHRAAPTNPVRHLRFQKIYFCSRALKEFTAAAGFDVEHGAVIYCPIDIDQFSGTPRGASRPLQRLLYVGRLNDDKGILTALRALALVRDKFAGRLSVYGEGEPAYEAKLNSYVAEQKLPVTFFRALPRERMPDVYRAHDALLFTSEWPEPFALAPLEAMACGLPVIGTMTGGSAELFRDRENSLTYAAGSATELAQRISELDKCCAMREALARNGWQEVRRRFSEPVIVDQIENYLHDAHRTWEPIKTPHYKE